MHSKHLRVWNDREWPHVLQVLFILQRQQYIRQSILLITHISSIWGIVYSTARELVAWGGDDVGTVILVENTHQCTPVPVISDTPTIVTLSSEITYGIKWNLLQRKVEISHLVDCTDIKDMYLILIEKHLQLTDTNTQVSLIKFIRDIPTKSTKFSSFLNKSMEKAKTKQQFLPLMLKDEGGYSLPDCWPSTIITYWFLTAIEEFRIRQRIAQIGPQYISLHSFRRLICHLHSILQYRDWEILWWVTSQPQSEVRMSSIWIELLNTNHVILANVKLVLPRYNDIYRDMKSIYDVM